MESLYETTWDVVLSGTGLPQSLLALALSRSGKKVLHVDKNEYYGGSNAALSLQDAEQWVKVVNIDSQSTPFRDATIHLPEGGDDSSTPDIPGPELGFSRAYSLSLSPELIYSRSTLLSPLVTSKVYRQLEFLAVGSWWIYEESSDANLANRESCLKKIPGGREDVFADKSIDLRSKRALMKFLKLAVDAEAQTPILEEWGERPFPYFLTSKIGVPQKLQAALLALTLSPNTPNHTTTSYALPRIHRHLTSIGVFGPGFGSVIPKWGGLAEIAQVGCRAGAVGGGVYILGKGIETISEHGASNAGATSSAIDSLEQVLKIGLQGGDEIRTCWIAGCSHDLSRSTPSERLTHLKSLTRSISIISSSLASLFPTAVEGAPAPAGAVVVFPTGSLKHHSLPAATELPPVYFLVHTHETGECPGDQCVIYSSIALASPEGRTVLDVAMQQFLDNMNEDPKPLVLWSLKYTQLCPPSDAGLEESADRRGVIQFPDSSPSLVFEDNMFENVRKAWQLTSGQTDGFLQFDDREVGAYDDEDE